MTSVRTNIDLDDELVAEAFRVTGLRTKRELVHEALQVLIAERRRRPLTELKGRIEFADGYDHKAIRSRRH